MRKICAWCKRKLEALDAEHEQKFPIIHGTCKTCFNNLLAQMGRPLYNFLDSLEVPILLMESGAVDLHRQ